MKTIWTAFIVAALAVATSQAENWAQWRGPHFDGSSPETGLLAEFSKTQNVKWTASLPGASAATPIIWGDYVFISAADPGTKTLRALSFDRKTGKQLWDQEAGVGRGYDDKSNFASPSPVTDGKVAVFL